MGNQQPAGKVQVPESMSRRGLLLIIDGEGARSHRAVHPHARRAAWRHGKILDFHHPLPFPGACPEFYADPQVGASFRALGVSGSTRRFRSEELWCVSSLTDCLVEGDSAAADLGQDGFCGGGPDEGSGAFVVHVHVLLDRGDQVGHAVKDPRRRALSVSSRNHRSTRFSQELEVGVKCRWKRGWAAIHAFTAGCLWVA